MGSLSGLVTVFIGAAGPLIAPFFIDRNLTSGRVSRSVGDHVDVFGLSNWKLSIGTNT